MGPPLVFVSVVCGNVSGWMLHEAAVHCRRRSRSSRPSGPEGVAEGVDGSAGVAEESFDDDEFDAPSRNRVAVECLRSWKQMLRRPAFWRRVLAARVRLVGSIGPPCAV